MKKLCKVLLCSILCFTLCACGTTYEDTNGTDDFRLQTITDENIINLDVGSSGLAYEELNLGILHSSEYSAKNFNGVERIYQTSFWGKSDVFVYIGHLNVEKGNFKLVVINNDKIIYTIPLDSFGERFLFEDLKGDFSIHVAGESAKFDFHIEVE